MYLLNTRYLLIILSDSLRILSFQLKAFIGLINVWDLFPQYSWANVYQWNWLRLVFSSQSWGTLASVFVNFRLETLNWYDELLS